MEFKSLFKVTLDDFEIFIVAKDEKEVRSLCFSCFDYESIHVKYIYNLTSDSYHPYFLSREEVPIG